MSYFKKNKVQNFLDEEQQKLKSESILETSLIRFKQLFHDYAKTIESNNKIALIFIKIKKL